ncbi:T6SS immunity protein Tli3 family protein [Cupriavidus agavae]|uniref:Tli3-like domain-containing protein n=1 Tax=Cupriavidus agavae TaxID=1001822 RepID=A0A4Q7RDS0_9BURK|nr:hypothetical protein [Cupriavidus agavae]RZT31313.1 hypothetical protein EV147_4494 [Cupriavidus agavae]
MKLRLAFITATIMANGCAVKQQTPPRKIRNYDVPPQVIYRIDDQRFVTLENYRDCHHGTTYYNDTRQGIRTKLGTDSFENYQGRLINADPSGQNLAFPASDPPERSSPERGSNMTVLYSTDGGRSFIGTYYMYNSWQVFRDSADYIIAVTSDRLYIASKVGRTVDDFGVDQLPLNPGIDLRKAYPPGVRGDSFLASRRPNYLNGLRTPSGQEYLSCDPSIRPTNLPEKKK